MRQLKYSRTLEDWLQPRPQLRFGEEMANALGIATFGRLPRPLGSIARPLASPVAGGTLVVRPIACDIKQKKIAVGIGALPIQTEGLALTSNSTQVRASKALFSKSVEVRKLLFLRQSVAPHKHR